MNLSKLIDAVHKDNRIRRLGIRKDEVKILAEVLIDHIGIGLLSHGIVKLRGLLTLKVKRAKGRKIQNPQTGEKMFSKDYNKVVIIPSKKIKNQLKQKK
ncbi:HU family DNA-binding protein [Bacillus velezensis]|uniref:HU family DNA-binding protein n=1 Tax=Bacillus velezensis TaxID=492670 RepID=UPI0018C653A1|nr:HU family DNA-binding protein [Bacillus velezensis]QPK89744.1 HU family DNA-binding protein [Bacillus velezensis]